MVFLHKKGLRAEPGNNRPITLMQVDVKVMSKVLAYCLQQVIPDVIHSDQKGFVKSRSIHHHVPFLADMHDLVTSLDEEAYTMILKFQVIRSSQLGLHVSTTREDKIRLWVCLVDQFPVH